MPRTEGAVACLNWHEPLFDTPMMPTALLCALGICLAAHRVLATFAALSSVEVVTTTYIPGGGLCDQRDLYCVGFPACWSGGDYITILGIIIIGN